ncbi:FMN-binding protein [bacterium]|nr:FMN-binding protein [bacterium]
MSTPASHTAPNTEPKTSSTTPTNAAPNAPANAPANPGGSAKMILTLGTVGLISSILLVMTYNWTLPYIEANQLVYLEASLKEVLPEATSRTEWRLVGEDMVPDDGSFTIEPRLFAGFRDDGSLQGVAIEAQGQGYADVIKIIYAYAPDCACIIGMKVLESRETPGLGDKIGNDENFKSNFDELDVRWNDERNATEGPLELIKQGTNLSAWQIDGISGATISSKAITDILNSSNEVVLKAIHARLDQLRAPTNE